MVRQRPVVSRASRWIWTLGVGIAFGVVGPLFADDPAPAKSPIEREPYRIKVVFAYNPAARLDAARRETLTRDWLTMVRRFVGAPWKITIPQNDPLSPLASDPDRLTPEPLAAGSEGFDKVWMIAVRGEGSGLTFVGREFDSATGRIGALQRLSAPVIRDAPRVLFQFSLDLFSPYAEIGERFGKDVSLTIRGAAIPSATPEGRVVIPGTVFQPLRVVLQKNAKPLIRDIAFTFLRAEALEGAGARCSVVSVYSDPFTKRVVQKTALVALGVKPGKSPTRLKFLTAPDRAPAAGYLLTVRDYPEGVSREVGSTDREGRIVLDPSTSKGLLVLRLLAGSSEPMIEFPLMPGDSTEERTIPPFDPKPATVALEARLDSLKDSVIDLVAIRARLEARLKARFDGEDWLGLEETLKEYRTLTPRETFATELIRLKDEASRQQAKTRSAVLTKTAQAQLSELQSLIERYLDDDVFKGFSDALDQAKSQVAAEKKKAVAKKKSP